MQSMAHGHTKATMAYTIESSFASNHIYKRMLEVNTLWLAINIRKIFGSFVRFIFNQILREKKTQKVDKV